MRTLRSLLHPRDEIVQTMERIYRYRMTTTSGGNLSVLDDDNAMWITPARVDKGGLRREDIVCVRADGNVEGIHPPSSEHPFHRSIYQARPDVRAIVHAHPVALVAFSICGQTPNTALFPQAHHVCGQVGFARYALPGSERLGQIIASEFASGPNCVMMQNHGVVVGGGSLQNAFERFETLEFTAKTIIKARMLGAVRFLSPEQIELAEQCRDERKEFVPGRATTAEKAVRSALCGFVQRGYHQRLMTSTEGSLSARLDADSFLITSYNVDRKSVDLDDLALISRGSREAGKIPSRAARIHEALYRKHPKIHAIVNAIPVNATAFSASTTLLDTRTIPESYIFLRDVARIPFDVQYGDPDRIAEMMSPEFPVALLENNGALVLGTTVLDAFDRLEVLESTAEAIINSRALGEVAPMNAEVIDELIAAFLTPKSG